jgi:riboflavin biosynthesis pyrimidine reductase
MAFLTTEAARPAALDHLAPFETLYDASRGDELPLSGELSRLYGSLRIPALEGRQYAAGNLVTSLDGVVSLGVPGKSSGKEISGFNAHDRVLMGLLRAAAAAVVSGAGTLRASPGHVLTPEHACPALAVPYRRLREAMGLARTPLNVVVSGSGDLDPGMAVLAGEVPALVVTTGEGARKLARRGVSREVMVEVAPGDGPIIARAVREAIARTGTSGLVLVEGGPNLMATFFAEGRLDEMFLTLSPQVAGRDGTMERPGLISGVSLAPEHPAWGTLVGVRRAESHLFLRYEFGLPAAVPVRQG